MADTRTSEAQEYQYETFGAADRVGPTVQAVAGIGSDDVVMLVRGSRQIPIRQLYGLPTSATGRAVLSILLKEVDETAQLISDEISVGVGRLLWSSTLSLLQGSLASHLTALRSLSSEDSSQWNISPGLQAILLIYQTWIRALLRHLQVLATPSCSFFTGRRARKAITEEAQKAPGFGDVLSIALAIHHCAGDGRSSPFPTQEECRAAPALSTWTQTVALFDATPFFSRSLTHLAERVIMFNKLLIHATASAARAYPYHNGFIRTLAFGLWNFLYTFSFNSAARRAAECLSEANFDFQLVKFLWNLPESPLIRNMFSVMVHDINMDELFSIPAAPNAPNDSFLNGAVPPAHIDPSMVMHPLPPSYASNHPYVRARLVSAGYLPFAPNRSPFATAGRRIFFKDPHGPVVTERLVGGLYGDFTLRYPMLPEPCPALIIHVHGGGFVAMTSFSHTAYMRKWALDTGIPVLSVDYRLAPEYPYPVQLEECWQAYRWAIKNAMRLGSLGERIILVGDSAGGNLVAGLTLRAMAEGFRRPDMLILAYPALVIAKAPSCSRIISTIDPMLNVGMLLNILNMYMASGSDGYNDPFLSPGVASDAALAQFPCTRILVGQFDPLLDDSVLLARRLAAVRHRDTLISVRPELGHGFLNLCDFVPEANEAVGLVSVWILQQMTAWGYTSAVVQPSSQTANPSIVSEPLNMHGDERMPLKSSSRSV